MPDIEAFFRSALAFADAHPLLVWLAFTALFNAIVRRWGWFQTTLVGRLFSAACALIGADPLGLVKFFAAGAGTRALGLAAGGLGTTPEALRGATAPPTDRPTEPPTDATPPPVSGGLGRRL